MSIQIQQVNSSQSKTLKSDNAITEDDQRDMEKEVQTLTDKFVKEIDQHVDNKEKEIMTV